MNRKENKKRNKKTEELKQKENDMKKNGGRRGKI